MRFYCDHNSSNTTLQTSSILFQDLFLVILQLSLSYIEVLNMVEGDIIIVRHLHAFS